MSVQFDKSRVKVLVTDDEPSLRGLISTHLSEEGWNVETAENGKDGLKKLQAGQFHIVLSDIQMPEMSGIEFLEATKKAQPNIEFIIMTSNATLETAMQAIKLGAYDYLTKPFDDLSVVSKKLIQVSEKIFLRQQNQELIRRLKKASLDLKKLFEFAASLMGILDEEKLRELSISFIPKLYQDDTARAAWLEGDKSNWKILKQTPNKIFNTDSIAGAIEDEVAKVSGLRNLKIIPVKKTDSTERFLVFEAIVSEMGDLWAHEVRTCFEGVYQHQQMVQLAHRDGLTKLYNHRYFQDRLRQEIAQVKRQQADLSLIIIDVDHFKQYNDQNGHPEGDKLLMELAKLFDRESSRRDSDIVARYGGEEFVFLLPFTDYEGALVKAERIREAVDQHAFDHGATQPLGKVSVSIGVATYPRHGVTPQSIMELADKSLYEAKDAGRNRVVGADALKGRESDASAKAKVTLEKVLGSVDEPPVVATSEVSAPVSTPSEVAAAVEVTAPVQAVAPVEAAPAVEVVAPVQAVSPVVEAQPVAEVAPAVEVTAQVVESAAPAKVVEVAPVVEVAAPVQAVAPVEAAPVQEAPIVTPSVPEQPKLSLKKKLLGPDVNVDNFLNSLDAVVDAAPSTPDQALKTALFSEESIASEDSTSKSTEVKRGTSSER